MSYAFLSPFLPLHPSSTTCHTCGATLPTTSRRPPSARLPSPPARTSPLSETSSPSPQEERPPPDYWANVGSVIETLRADYPLFPHQSPTYSIYSPNIHLTDRRTLSLHGIDQYRRFLWALRLHLRLFFKERSIQIQSLYHDTKSSTIYLRWRARLVPRLVGWWKDQQGQSKVVWIYDAMSVYTLGRDGRVVEHVLDNAAHSRSKLRPLFEDILSLGRVGVPLGQTPAGVGLGCGNGWWFEKADEIGKMEEKTVLKIGEEWKWIADAKNKEIEKSKSELKDSNGHVGGIRAV